METRSALLAYSVGLAGLILVKVLAPGFYSRQDIRTPVKIALGVLVLTQLMNLVFVRLFAHAGLALSIGLASLVNAALLYRGLRKRKAYVPAPGWSGFWLRLLIAMAVMGAILYFGARLPGDWARSRVSCICAGWWPPVPAPTSPPCSRSDSGCVISRGAPRPSRVRLYNRTRPAQESCQ